MNSNQLSLGYAFVIVKVMLQAKVGCELRIHAFFARLTKVKNAPCAPVVPRHEPQQVSGSYVAVCNVRATYVVR